MAYVFLGAAGFVRWWVVSTILRWLLVRRSLSRCSPEEVGRSSNAAHGSALDSAEEGKRCEVTKTCCVLFTDAAIT